jgi:hypothetical protein
MRHLGTNVDRINRNKHGQTTRSQGRQEATEKEGEQGGENEEEKQEATNKYRVSDRSEKTCPRYSLSG